VTLRQPQHASSRAPMPAGPVLERPRAVPPKRGPTLFVANRGAIHCSALDLLQTGKRLPRRHDVALKWPQITSAFVRAESTRGSQSSNSCDESPMLCAGFRKSAASSTNKSALRCKGSSNPSGMSTLEPEYAQFSPFQIPAT
jgi:hypothetical protein